MILDARGSEVNGNGASLTDRQMAKIRAQTCTVGEANDMAHQHAVNAVNHMGNQIPALIHTIVAQAIQGFYDSLKERGMLLEPVTPQAPESAPNAENTEEVSPLPETLPVTDEGAE